MKPSEEERALETLFRAGRAGPSAANLARLESRLSPWLDSPRVRTADGRRGTALKSMLFLVACALVSPSDEIRAEDVPPAPRSAAPAAPAAPHVSDGRGDRERPFPAPNTEASLSVASLPDAPLARGGGVPTPARSNPISAAAPARVVEARPNVESAPVARAEPESSFLRRAQGTLAGDPARALSMLEEHPTRYPHSVLVQEREVMAIDALARLGRRDEARARANAFAAQYPRSAHESRIASILKEGSQ